MTFCMPNRNVIVNRIIQDITIQIWLATDLHRWTVWRPGNVKTRLRLGPICGFVLFYANYMQIWYDHVYDWFPICELQWCDLEENPIDIHWQLFWTWLNRCIYITLKNILPPLLNKETGLWFPTYCGSPFLNIEISPFPWVWISILSQAQPE
jgi:hypothetical protein